MTTIVHSLLSPTLTLHLESGDAKADKHVFHLSDEQLAELKDQMKKRPADYAGLVRIVNTDESVKLPPGINVSAAKGTTTSDVILAQQTVALEATFPQGEITPPVIGADIHTPPVPVPAPQPPVKSTLSALLK